MARRAVSEQQGTAERPDARRADARPAGGQPPEVRPPGFVGRERELAALAQALMAQFLQSAQHYTPLQTGIRLLPWTAAAMVASPIAGQLAERYGNRPFMAGGLFLQAAGLAWMAAIATPRLGYGELGAALTVAGIGIGLVFPTVSGEIVASVPPGEIGVASGTNSALRELGGVFGVAVLATVFARPSVYTSPYLFADGFKAALWVGASFSAAGVLMAVSAGRRTKPTCDQPAHSAPEISRPAPVITSETS